MAYDPNERFDSVDLDPSPRIFPDQDGVMRATFAAVGAAPEYEALTPVAINSATDQWVVWTTGGANETGVIRGLIYPDAVQTDAADEVLGQVMFAGLVHFDDIPVPAGETSANLKAALKDAATRGAGLKVQGLGVVGGGFEPPVGT